MVSHRALTWILIASLALSACRTFAPDPPTPASTPGPLSPPETSTPEPDYAPRLRNAQYQLGLTDSLRIVQLTDGKYELGQPGSEDYTSVTVTDLVARGDLDGDGFDEYAALVAENYGGSGVFVFLAVFSDVDGSLRFDTSTLVDDRPILTELSISGGEVFLDATVHRSDEPMCCPTLKTVRHYRLYNGQLFITDYATFTPDGRPRTIRIEAPADGAEVFRSVPIKGSVAIAPFENNLVYRIVDLGGVELSIGPIAVTAADFGAPGTFEQNILLGNALSAAVIRVEVRDISAEDGSLLAMDSVELVVK